ncbi:MAG: ABC transporter ATP-binding protein [Clostridia bacterium]|nr:ABC transporter ATP-binding protein [Clostridia bacterium]
MSNILECVHLTKKYGHNIALNDVSVSIPSGKIVGLLGPNGSGKTTLIKLIAGLLVPNGGELYINGSKPGPETKAIISYLPERPYFDPSMRICEMLDFFADFYADFDMERAVKMLSDLGISQDAKMKTLSKGTKEKVQLVLVMSRRAKLYLLDEPIAGVDPAARDYIMRTILTNYGEDSTILISTHLITDIEKVLDEYIFISNGNIFRQGTVDDVRTEEGKSLDELFREVFRC